MSVLFGIWFDDIKYNELEKYFVIIKKKKDLVCDFKILNCCLEILVLF